MGIKPLIVGNWKMNLNKVKSLALVDHVMGVQSKLDTRLNEVEIGVAPVGAYLSEVYAHLKQHRNEGNPIRLGAQHGYEKDEGAYTGEVSMAQWADVGCDFVIIGHSERRQFFGETIESTAKKVVAALKHGLTPLLCVGEHLHEREASQTLKVVGDQLEGAMSGLTASELQRCVVAYEPVWAIGTGKVAHENDAEEVHQFIREQLMEKGAPNLQILYGGSVKPDNAKKLLDMPNINGALVGGASIVPEQFESIIRAALS